MTTLRTIFTLCALVVTAACAPSAETAPTAEVIIVRELATVFLTPTPDAAQIQATRLASSPTPAPPTATVIPTATPYVGIFIGRAEREQIISDFTEALFRPVPTGEPTADATRCGIPIGFEYLDAWRTDERVHDRLRCPIQVSFGFFGEVQIFEHGVMYRRPETREVWAVVTAGGTGRYWYVEAPETASPGSIQVPPGLRAPSGDFGSVWAGVEGLRTRLGFAQTQVQDAALGIQRFDGGTFFLDASSGQVFALIVDGTAYGPFIAPQP